MTVISTIEERCKRCYTCIRECPAKAIKVENGQAKVIGYRCVGCGHCVTVCSQNAKKVQDGVEETLELLKGEENVVAMLAPSFAGAFVEVTPEQIIGALRECGFSHVIEVAFGADLINLDYKEIAGVGFGEPNSPIKQPMITSSCPAIIKYIEKYAPDLIEHLAPVVSPMVAAGRVVHECIDPKAKRVFIGPCTAKKIEIDDDEVRDSVETVLTFDEMETMFGRLGVEMEAAKPTWFDPPHPYLGRIYPISGGLIRSSGMTFDIMDNDIILTEGKHRIMNLLENIRTGDIKAKIVDVLFCEGCINGPYMNHDVNYFARKQKIVEFTKKHRDRTKLSEWEDCLEKCGNVETRRAYTPDLIPTLEPSEADTRKILARINKFQPSDELNCGACGYATCREYASAVFQELAEEEMCLPFLIEKYERIQRELRKSLQDLANAQEQLIQTEKLASIGQLAAGVAHEVNNPLGSIILFSHLMLQQMGEQNPNTKDLKFIIDEANRCRGIVSGLLDFARQGRLNLRQHSIDEILRKVENLVEKQANYKNMTLEIVKESELPEIEMDVDQIYQVFLNLVQNANEAMPEGGKLAIHLRLNPESQRLSIDFRDSGVGIPPENIKKLFTPFFTTKQLGKGTGLGLAIAYGIIKMHKGNIRVHSAVGEGTIFTIEIPVRAKSLGNHNIPA